MVYSVNEMWIPSLDLVRERALAAFGQLWVGDQALAAAKPISSDGTDCEGW
jgi:hypothetical protein